MYYLLALLDSTISPSDDRTYVSWNSLYYWTMSPRTVELFLDEYDPERSCYTVTQYEANSEDDFRMLVKADHPKATVDDYNLLRVDYVKHRPGLIHVSCEGIEEDSISLLEGMYPFGLIEGFIVNALNIKSILQKGTAPTKELVELIDFVGSEYIIPMIVLEDFAADKELIDPKFYERFPQFNKTSDVFDLVDPVALDKLSTTGDVRK